MRQFSADDRDFGEFDASKRNARVFSVGTIESTLIGAASGGGVSVSSNTGDSHRRVRRIPSVSDVFGFWHGADNTWDHQTKQAPLSGGEARVEDVGFCATRVSLSASASYPFGPYGFDLLTGLTPDIDYNVIFIFEVTGKNQVTVTLTGTHNRFPDYEGYADGSAFYQYSSSGGGPNHFNLGLTWRGIPIGTRHIIDEVEVSACCPSMNK